MNAWIETLLQPLPLALLWMVLHSLDYALTLRGAHWFRKKAAEHFDAGGSYELNPLFARDIDRGTWLSKRFLFTLFATAALLATLSWAVHQVARPDDRFPQAELDFLVGFLVFTRVGVIARHLQNIWTYRALALGRAKLTGSIRYDRPTLVRISAMGYLAQGAGVLVAAAAIPPNAFLYGGTAGILFLGVWLLVIARKVEKALAKSAAPASPPASPSPA